ncbi:MAG TPA: hypothetical protein VF731_05155 [Solirubrobacterales bacterium]
MCGIDEERAIAETLKGCRVEGVELEQQEGDAYSLVVSLDDGSVVHIEAWGNTEAMTSMFGVPPTTRWGLSLWRISPEEVAEVEREAEELEKWKSEHRSGSSVEAGGSDRA